jgi:hypothetical protein
MENSYDDAGPTRPIIIRMAKINKKLKIEKILKILPIHGFIESIVVSSCFFKIFPYHFCLSKEIIVCNYDYETFPLPALGITEDIFGFGHGMALQKCSRSAERSSGGFPHHFVPPRTSTAS